MKKITLILFALLTANIASYAEDTADQVYGEASPSSPVNLKLSNNERLTVLERQVANLNQQNNPAQIQDFQSQLADLKGRIETLDHEYQQLNDQLKQQYKDLDQRLQDMLNSKTPTDADASLSTAKKSAKLSSNEQAMENPSATKTPQAEQPGESSAYQKAFTLLKAKDYPRAIPKLQNFLSKYPNGQYAANAHFWLGEIYLLQGQPDMAATEYHTVINNFPQSDKIPMAQLKLGFAYQDQGNLAKARAQYQKVIKLYSNATAAKLASQKLEQLSSSNKKTSGT